jgi:PDZ domain
MEFKYLSTMIGGDGEMLYKVNETEQKDPNQKKIIAILKLNKDRNVKDFFAPGTSIPDPPDYRVEVDELVLKCDESKYTIDKTEFWNASNELVRLLFLFPSMLKFSEFQVGSPFDTLQQIACNRSYGGIGIRIELTNNMIGVAEVFDGSPAEKVGLKLHDIITRINDEAVNNPTLPQTIGKLRGPVGSKVNLTVTREGQTGPIELTITRGNVQTVSTQLRPPK